MVKPTLELFEKLSTEIGKSTDTTRTINSISDPELKEYIKTCNNVVVNTVNVGAIAAASGAGIAAVSATIGSAVAAGGSAIGIGTGVAIGGASAVAAGGIGAAAGSAVPIIGTIIGGLVGLGVGAIVGASVKADQENKKKAAYNEIVRKLNSVNEALSKELKEKTRQLEILKQQNRTLEEEYRRLQARIDYIVGTIAGGEAAKKSLA